MNIKFLFLLLLPLLGNTSNLHAQDTTARVNAAIMEEGKRLYHSEMASWYGTDVFLDRYKDQRENIGGYFSYSTEGTHKCVFFSKGETPTVLATITFDSTFAVDKAQADASSRGFSSLENDLFTIRKKALEDVNSHKLYETYNNTNLNLIPLIHGGERKVYILTGPQVGGLVIFGNDYLLPFDSGNNLVSRRKLHKSLIPVEYGKEKDKQQVGAVHTHLPETGDFMTPTDVCTLMLYAGKAGWAQYYVASQNYFSIWDVKTSRLTSLTNEAMNRLSEDQQKRKKNK